MNITQSNKHRQALAIRLPRVCEITASSKATIWRRVQQDPTFPKPFKLSPGVTAWDQDEVFAWVEAKKSTRGAA